MVRISLIGRRDVPHRMRSESLSYTQSILRELRDMALGNRDTMLAYLVEMAYLEASDMLRQHHAETLDSASPKSDAA